MKKVLFVAVILSTLTSCAAYLPTPKTVVDVTDYSVFHENGIYVTESNSVSFDYKSIGHISVEAYGGWVDKKTTSKDKLEAKRYNNDDYYDSPSSSSPFRSRKYVLPNIDDAISIFIDKVKASKGNGVINFKIENEMVPDIIDKKILLHKIIVSGMAIEK